MDFLRKTIVINFSDYSMTSNINMEVIGKNDINTKDNLAYMVTLSPIVFIIGNPTQDMDSLLEGKYVVSVSDTEEVSFKCNSHITTTQDKYLVIVEDIINAITKPGLVTVGEYEVQKFLAEKDFKYISDVRDLYAGISGLSKIYLNIVVGIDGNLFDVNDCIEDIESRYSDATVFYTVIENKLLDGKLKVDVFYK